MTLRQKHRSRVQELFIAGDVCMTVIKTTNETDAMREKSHNRTDEI